MHVHRVRKLCGIHEAPHFGAAERDDLVDPVHLPRLAVDGVLHHPAVEAELAHLRLGGAHQRRNRGERLRHPGSLGHRLRDHEFQEVEVRALSLAAGPHPPHPHPHLPHRRERQRLQHHARPHGESAEVDQQVGAFAGAEVEPEQLLRGGEQATVVADQRHRGAGGEAEPGDAGTRAVHNAESIERAVDVVRRLHDAVAEHRRAEEALHPLVHHGSVGELVVRIEASFLQQQRNLPRPARQAEGVLLGVADEEEPRHAAVDLFAGMVVRMRVVPIRARAIQDRELVAVRRTGLDGEARGTIGGLGDGEPVPVEDRLLRELVLKRDLREVATSHPNRRAGRLSRAVTHDPRVRLHTGRDVGSDLAPDQPLAIGAVDRGHHQRGPLRTAEGGELATARKGGGSGGGGKEITTAHGETRCRCGGRES